MADPAPKTQGWSARENKHKPRGLHLVVSGSVEVGATNKRALLTEAPQVGKVLPLNLSIRNERSRKKRFKAKQITVLTDATFHKRVRANQFDRVEIRWGKAAVAAVPVIDDREHTAQRAEKMAAVNAQADVADAPKPTDRVIEMRSIAQKVAKEAAAAREAAAKKAAPKGAAKKVAAERKPKSLGGWAKAKKVKKTPKKAAKKTAKRTSKKRSRKTAKSSTLKKLVRKLVRKLTPASKKKSKRR